MATKIYKRVEMMSNSPVLVSRDIIDYVYIVFNWGAGEPE